MSAPSRDELRGMGQGVVDAAVHCAALEYSMMRYVPGVPMQYGQGAPAPDSGAPPLLPAGYKNFLHSTLADVPELFASFAGPDPDDCDRVVGQINAVRQALGDDVSGDPADQPPAGSWTPAVAVAPTLNAIANQARGWVGAGAQAFGTYVDNIRGRNCIVDHQTETTKVLTVGIAAHQKILTWAYEDIQQIGHDTIKVLDAGGSGGCVGPGATIALQIASDVAWVAAAALAEVPIAAIGMTAIAAAAGNATTIAGPGEQNAVIHGSTALQVISSMYEAIGKLTGLIAKQEGLVSDHLRSAYDTADRWYYSAGPNAVGLYPPPPGAFSQPAGWTAM
ncbi:hypothetical protein [Actinocatenispora rupis]|uniref:Uncharacterized protein n=1 Tax=Actinocatenispora rupis TaxID=519421 RepID=A0A8J3JB66_9ACTN|nr:hypothetical protein [Actinocatenispora rupis]GID11553.1 hypothetical protein Aru02nite_24420 [Actinocatenispora rupis]